jgi:hypothetical protein
MYELCADTGNRKEQPQKGTLRLDHPETLRSMGNLANSARRGIRDRERRQGAEAASSGGAEEGAGPSESWHNGNHEKPCMDRLTYQGEENSKMAEVPEVLEAYKTVLGPERSEKKWTAEEVEESCF